MRVQYWETNERSTTRQRPGSHFVSGQAPGDFLGAIQVDTSIAQPSIIFKSDEYYYQNGYTLTVLDKDTNIIPSGDYKFTDIKHNYIGIQITNNKYNGQQVSFKIVAKPEPSDNAEEFMQ